jgi:hypothetical protein
MALTAQELEKQKQQVEEMLAGPETLGFAKSLFFGHFKGEMLFPYPSLPPDKQQEAEENTSTRALLTGRRRFLRRSSKD